MSGVRDITRVALDGDRAMEALIIIRGFAEGFRERHGLTQLNPRHASLIAYLEKELGA